MMKCKMSFNESDNCFIKEVDLSKGVYLRMDYDKSWYQFTDREAWEQADFSKGTFIMKEVWCNKEGYGEEPGFYAPAKSELTEDRYVSLHHAAHVQDMGFFELGFYHPEFWLAGLENYDDICKEVVRIPEESPEKDIRLSERRQELIEMGFYEDLYNEPKLNL